MKKMLKKNNLKVTLKMISKMKMTDLINFYFNTTQIINYIYICKNYFYV